MKYSVAYEAYEVLLSMKWWSDNWMRRDHHTGWMVPCSLQPVYAIKYVKWKQEGEVCVDVRLIVFLDWRAVSWRWCGRSRNVYQSLPVGEEFSSVFTCFLFFTCFLLLGCVFVRNGVVWRINFIYFCFFSCFLLLFLFCISHSAITVIFPKILYISRPHQYARHKYGLLLSM